MDWNIQALGSGYDINVYLKQPLQPGQTQIFPPSTVEVSAFTESTFSLTDTRVRSIDTNLNNNTGSICCLTVVFGLPACSAS